MSIAMFTRVDQYWGQFFGCGSELIRCPPAPYLLTTAAQPGLWALTCGGSWVVAASPIGEEGLPAQLAACFRPDQLPAQDQLQSLRHAFPGASPFGPAILFLHHEPAALPPIDPSIRPLTGDDQCHIAAFAATTDSLSWTQEQANGWLRVFGYFCGQTLVATCGVYLWGDLLAEIYIDTLPAYRGRGYAKAVTTAALHWIATATPYYAESVVDLSNEPSLRLMHSLGFVPYGYLVTVC